MIINIQSRGFSLTPALKAFAQQRMNFVLARYGEKISRINVTLLDINGPKGGIDKRCTVNLKLEGAASIVVQATHGDLYDAIISCGNRLRRTVNRRITQLRGRRRTINYSEASEGVEA